MVMVVNAFFALVKSARTGVGGPSGMGDQSTSWYSWFRHHLVELSPLHHYNGTCK